MARENGTLVYLSIEKIYPHPDNPRKELGDLSELVESIKANGVLQNLTVVPYGQDVYDGEWEDEYRVIIGHRRLAAAKKAGLKTLPCIIADMTEEEQIATMLVENMQRTDLTIYEQAKSFQQLQIDFGKTVSEISAMSGFSEATVRRRRKLADLDDQKLKAACRRGATLFELAELDKIEDDADKLKVLDAVGTVNFRNVLKTTLDAQKDRARRVKWLEQLAGFATQIEQANYVAGKYVDMNFYRTLGSWTRDEEIKAPEEMADRRFFYIVQDSSISMYVEAKEDPVADAEQRRKDALRNEQQAKSDQLEAISKRHYELRRDFVVNFGAFRGNMDKIQRFACDAMLYAAKRASYYFQADYKNLCKLLGIEGEKEGPEEAAWNESKENSLEKTLLLTAFWIVDGVAKAFYRREWSSKQNLYINIYQDNEALVMVYNILEALGYECSDEEMQMRRGTHPLLDKEEE